MTFFIGNIKVENPVLLAPMSGITDKPFRRLVRKFGVGLTFSEMIASKQMISANNETIKMSQPYENEGGFAVQLAGNDPSIMAEAALMNESRGAAVIDINMGCPVKKIVKGYAGSALMKDESHAIKIIEAVVTAVKIPVTLKMRLGWDAKSINCVSIAKNAENSGIKMITVHGRTRMQMYSGEADWITIKQVKENVNIPVVVNGDIINEKTALQALKTSGADAVMLGRGCFGRPWLPSQVIHFLKTKEVKPAPSLSDRCDILLAHYTDILSHYGERLGIRIARKHIAWSLSGLHNANQTKQKINIESKPTLVIQHIKECFDHNLQLSNA